MGKSLEIGAETKAEEIKNIVFEDCDIIHVTGTALDCCNVDYADVHDVVYQNIRVEYDDRIPQAILQKKDGEQYPHIDDPAFAPSLIAATVVMHEEYSAGGTRRGNNRNIIFRNIYLFGHQMPIIHFKGYDEEHKTRDIIVENIYQNGKCIDNKDDMDIIIRDYVENVSFMKDGKCF